MKKRNLWKKVALFLSLLVCFTAAGCDLGFGLKEPCVQCVDENSDHVCDVCLGTISACTDLDSNHLCDTCGVSTGTCVDADNDHVCDVCGGAASACRDTDRNHKCDICVTTISNCKDDNDDHFCDVCGTRLSPCMDEDTDEICDVCGESMLEYTPTVYEVKFYEGDVLKSTVPVQEGQTVAAATATQKAFYEFIGWKTDGQNGNFYDFDRAVVSNLTLHAYYEIDYAAFTNELTQNYMDGLVSVHTQFVWTDGYTYNSTGSGVIYAQIGNYYYALTNNHVVYELHTSWAAGRAGNLTVRDSYNNLYSANLLCYDAEYDLAVIRFAKDSQNRFHPEVFEFADADPVLGQEIVSLGSPHGQKNAVTYGKVLGTKTGCQMSEQSSVDFACIKHDAWITNGSSGGMLMDMSFKIVGINFAVQTNTSEEYMYSLSIPMTKVREFLSANDLLLGA